MTTQALFADQEIDLFADLEQPEEQQPLGETLRKLIAGEATYVSAQENRYEPIVRQQQYIGAYNQLKTEDNIDGVLHNSASAYSNSMREVLNTYMQKYIDSNPNDVDGFQEEVMTVSEAHGTLDEDMTVENAFDVAFVESAASTNMDTAVQKEQMFRFYAQRQLAELLDKQDVFDKVVNYTALLWPDITYDISQFLEGSWFNNYDDFYSFQQNFFSLSPKDKVIAWKEIQEQAYETFDSNEVKTAIFLATLIDPVGADEVKTQGYFDAFDIGTAGVTAGIALTRPLFTALRSMRLNKKLMELENVDEAGMVTAMEGLDEAGADALSASRFDTASTINPFNTEEFIGGIDGLSEATVRNLEGHIGQGTKLDTILNNIHRFTSPEADSLFLKEGFIPPDTRERLIAEALNKQQQLSHDYRVKLGVDMRDVRVIKSDEDGFTIGYKLEGLDLEHKVAFTIDDETGSFMTTELGKVPATVLSPSRLFQDDPYLVSGFTRTGDQGARLSAGFKQAYKEALKPIEKGLIKDGILDKIKYRKRYRQLDEILVLADNHRLKQTLTPIQLKQGFFTNNEGKVIHFEALSDDGVKAYYGVRRVLDQLWELTNYRIRREYQAKGYKDIDIYQTVDGAVAKQQHIGKPHDTIEAAHTSIRHYGDSLSQGKGKRSRSNWIYIYKAPTEEGASGSFNKYPSHQLPSKTGILQQWYDEGYKLYRLDTPVLMKNAGDTKGSYIDYALIKEECCVHELPYTMLNKEPNYIPRIYNKGTYFVKEIEKEGLTHTRRIMYSKKDAEDFVNTQNKYLGEEVTGSKWIYKFDRELTPYELEEETINMFGGLYSGKRAKDRIIEGTGVPNEAEFPDRVNSLGAIQRYMNHVASVIPMNEYRMAMQKRWLNTAEKIRVQKGYAAVLEKPWDFHSDILLDKFSSEAVALESLRSYINDVMRLPTFTDKLWTSGMRRLAETTEKTTIGSIDWSGGLYKKKFGKPYDATIYRGLQWASSKDPYALMRTMAFHPLLGFWNFSQLVVQSAGATLAVSLDPVNATKYMRQYSALRMLSLAKHFPKIQNNPEKMSLIYNKIAKASDLKVDDLKELHLQWERTGLEESIMLNADFNAAKQGFGIGIEGLKKITDSGLLFYREGELVNRGYTWLMARNKWMTREGRGVLNTADEKAVIDEAYKVGLNFSRMNRAQWQKGALSVPTQFQQVMAKFMEQFIPGSKNWTKGEKAKVLTGQLILFGAAGVPTAEYIINNALRMAGYEAGDLSETERRTIQEGITGLFLELMDADVTVVNRMAFSADPEHSVIGKLFDGGPSTASAYFGAFGTVMGRAENSISLLKPIFGSADTIHDLTANDLLAGASQLGRISSSWRNIHKSMYHHNLGIMFDNHGNKIKETRPNLVSEIGQALGFKSKDVEITYDMLEYNKDKSTFYKEILDDMVQLRVMYLHTVTGEVSDPQAARRLLAAEKILFAGAGLSPDEEQKMYTMLGQRLSQNEGKYVMEHNKLFNNIWLEQGAPRVEQTVPPLMNIGQ